MIDSRNCTKRKNKTEICEGFCLSEDPGPSFSTFFQTFGDFLFHKKAHIFLKTHVKFYSWNMFSLEDIDENVSGYGNHNEGYS